MNDFNLFPNIEKVKIIDVEDLEDENTISQLELAQLKHLDISIDNRKEHLLETVIDTFPKLTHFSLGVNSDDENAIYKSLKNISNLKHLIHFKLHIKFGIINNLFCDLLKQMAINCRNLKSIDCRFVINDKNSDIKQLFSQLKAFPALKRLKLCSNCVSNEVEDNIDVNQLFSFELFKDLSNISHLALGFNFGQTLKEWILKEIDNNLPKLQYLEIENRFDTFPEGVQQMADILSRLSRMETLKLKFKSNFRLDLKSIEEQITENCRKIRKIELSS